MTSPGRFDELLRLWTDGEASPAELKELALALRENPERRRELVRCTMVEVNLYGRYAASAGAGATRPTARTRAWEVAAAALVLALSAFLLGRLFLMKKPEQTAVVKPEVVPAVPKFPPLAKPALVEKVGRLLDRAKVSLSQAVDLAVQSWPGIPVKTELSEDDGKLVWTVLLAFERKLREVEIDAVSGRILEAQEEKGDESAVAGALKIPLRTALEKALAAVPGRAAEAEAELKKGRPVVEFMILHEGDLHEVRIDGETGQLIK
jgi:uncharacterized membrane protein YkoI